MNDFDSPKPKRRWYQFSLRTLMLLVLAVGMVFGWIGIRMRRAHTNRQAIAAAEKALAEICERGGMLIGDESGFFVSYVPNRSITRLGLLFDDPGDPHDPEAEWFISIAYLAATDAGLEDLRGLLEDPKEPLKAELISIYSLGSPRGITDAGLKHLKGVTDLTTLDLLDTQVTDSGLKNLAGLKHLEWLILENTKVTGAGLVHLKGMTNLVDLNLASTGVTDAGLGHLVGLASLEHLNLASTGVTDAGLGHLAGLTNLQELDLQGTKVTDTGVVKLQRVLPNCTIYR